MAYGFSKSSEQAGLFICSGLFTRSGLFTLLLLPSLAGAAAQVPLLSVTSGGGSEDYSVNLQIFLVLTALTFLPTLLMVTTSFTRILIVLAILKQALGLQQIPPSKVLVGMALILTGFVMRPVFEEIWTTAVNPYLEEKMTFRESIERAGIPIHRFMRLQTRTVELEQFITLADDPKDLPPEDIPFSTLIPAFLSSELKTGFQMGFLIFLPFLLIDLLVASILMALGMIMLSPLVVSAPLKLLLFVLVDGWGLLVGSTIKSFAL